MSVFRLTMIPANEGDCLILSYGASETALRHVLIDGGTTGSWKRLKPALAAIGARGEEIELMVLSHIDGDHIDGLLKLAQDPALPLAPKAVWHNGFRQIEPFLPATGGPGLLGVPNAEKFSVALAARGWALNTRFGGSAITVEKQASAFAFAGLTLTLLSPGRDKLEAMAIEWKKKLGGAALGPAGEVPLPEAGAMPGSMPGLMPGLLPLAMRPFPAVLDVEALCGPSKHDEAEANGASIALIAEFDGKRVLLGADAHPDQIATTLAANAGEDGRCRFDLVKLPHHGSQANVTREVIELLDCRRFAFSTSGSKFGHPDPEAIARILKFGNAGTKTFWFNYASDRTTPWDDPALKAQWDYACVFPPPGADAPTVIDI